jgi:OOP family OmpA-OmpF porin
LRDPLASDPQKFVGDAGLNPDKVVAAWEPYHALSSEFVLKRAQHALQPPDSIHLSYKDGVLDAAGVASKEWISESRILARALPGVTSYHDENVVETGRQRFAQVRQRLESLVVRFQDNSTLVVPGQEREIDELVAGVRQLHELGPKSTREFRIQIIGHTDTTGTENVNLALSRNRAEAIRSILEARLGPSAYLEVLGAGTTAPLRPELSEQDKELNRSVTIKVFVTY